MGLIFAIWFLLAERPPTYQGEAFFVPPPSLCIKGSGPHPGREPPRRPKKLFRFGALPFDRDSAGGALGIQRWGCNARRRGQPR